jgi:hypothetical protein
MDDVFAKLTGLPESAEFYVDVCINAQPGYEDIVSMCRSENQYMYATHGPVADALKVPADMFDQTRPDGKRLIKRDALQRLFEHVMTTAERVEEVQIFILYIDDPEDQPSKRSLDAFMETTLGRAYQGITKVRCTHKPHPIGEYVSAVHAINDALAELTCDDTVDFMIALHLDQGSRDENAFSIRRVDGNYWCNPYGFASGVPIEQPDTGISGETLGSLVGQIRSTDLVKSVTVNVAAAAEWPVAACATRLSAALSCKVDVKLTDKIV